MGPGTGPAPRPGAGAAAGRSDHREAVADPPSPIQDRVDRLDETLKTLDPYLQEPAASAGALVNPLLVVWDAAHAVHPEVAAPVEKLLTGLLHRTMVPVDDVLVAVEDMRARALQVLVLTGRVVVG